MGKIFYIFVIILDDFYGTSYEVNSNSSYGNILFFTARFETIHGMVATEQITTNVNAKPDIVLDVILNN